MDGTVTMQDPSVKCGSCQHFEMDCAVTNPDSEAGECNEYEAKIAANKAIDICKVCARNHNNCIPNQGAHCTDFVPDYDISHFNEEVKTVMPKPDMVNHPSHYTQGGIECIKAIEASMPPDGFQDYCKGNILKYIWRWRDKAGLEDLKKARVYLNWMIESVEKEQNAETKN